MNNWKETAKDVLDVTLAIGVIVGVVAVAAWIDPMLIASDDFVEFLTGF
jgi:hypothetical protein